MQTVPQLLELLAQVNPQNDPRGMQQRYLSFALFDGGGMLSRSLEGVDREALYEAVRAGLKNQDGRARGSIGSVYRNLSAAEIKPLVARHLSGDHRTGSERRDVCRFDSRGGAAPSGQTSYRGRNQRLRSIHSRPESLGQRASDT
jgi:hypothetical protein